MNFINTDLPDIIELRNVSQAYDNNVILKDFNLLIEDKPNVGQFVCLLGASGCGKSTILRYITGLQEPTSGEVLFKGKPLTREDRVGMVFQQYSSFPWLSVLENVALGLEFQGISKKERSDRAIEMLKMVGLEKHKDKYAKYPTLSGGQLQRVAIARSLLSNPEIIVMDEPFGALDINTRLKMQDMLMEIWVKVKPTIILVTHDISEAVYLGEEIYLMQANPGNIVEQVKPNFSINRTSDLKRTSDFINTVHFIEDKMMGLETNIQK
jgi:NitT/TauT family transport system ATP-binding protein